MKIKALNPTMREKKRYIKLDCSYDSFVSRFKELFGTYGMANAGIQEVSSGIIRINAKYIDHAKAAVLLAKGKIVYISGNLSKVR